MKRKHKLLLLSFALLFLSAVVRAQSQSYASGTVKDEKGNALGGTSVSEKDRPSNGTTTDSLGRFILQMKGKSNTIIISYVGYEERTVKLTGSPLSITLKASGGNTNNEVVVVGYQTQRRRNVTGSVATVSGKDIENIPAASFDQLLQGRAAGVSVQSSTGAPGARANVVIRGSTNTDYGNANGGNNQPLYVIDGVIFDVNNMQGASATNNPLTLLNPNDIESIDILKDASAAAIYGARGGNGVIIVKTRRAQRNARPEIDVSGYAGATIRPNLRKVWTGTLERQLKLGLLYSQLPYADISNALVPTSLTDSLNPAFNNSVDWQGLIIREQAIVNNQDIYASGFLGGNNSYRIGVNHYSEQGAIRGYSLERVSPTLNLILNPIRHVSILANLILSSEKRNHLVAGTDVYNPNLFSNSNFPSSFAQLSPTLLSLYNNTNNKYDDNKIFTYNANIQVVDTITRDLTATVSYGSTNYIDKYAYFSPKELNGIQNVAYDNQNQNPNWNFESNLRYIKSIKDHQFVVLAGYSAYNAQRYYTYSSASGINVSGIYTVQTVPPGSNLNTGTGKEVKNTMSYYGNFQYGFKNRYLLTGSLRRDASSIYSPEYRWGTFSAVSAGWIVSDEKFMEPLKTVVNFLKLRASYGVTGSDPGSWYSKYQTLSSDASFFGSTTGTIGGNVYGSYLTGLPTTYNGTSVISPFYHNGWFYSTANRSSPSVRWESIPQVDIGGDMSLFNNRINFTVDWYQRDVINKFLWAIPSDPTTGYYYYSGNYANVRNRGLELAVNTNVFSPKSQFQWNMSFNISFNKNLITKLPNGGRDLLFGETYFRKLLTLGKPLFTYGMFDVTGVYATDADVPVDPITGKKLTFYGNTAFQAGDERITDQNGDYTINDQDQVALNASPNPKFYGGFNNTFSFKRFSLNVFATYSYGNKVLNGALSDILNGSASYASWTSVAGPAGYTDILNKFWQATGYEATYPRIVYPSTQNAYAKDPWNLNRSFFLEDGGFIKLKTATLSYAFTNNVAKKLGLRNLSVYVMGYNLFIIKQAKDIPDPELYDVTTGSVNNVYPTARKFQLGFQVGL